MEDEIKTTREAIGAVSDLIKVAGDAPQAREAAKNLGDAAVTITKTINMALLPLAAVNFAFDKAKAYFSGDFQRDLIDRTKDIPFECITEPKASVAGPALQGLAFTHEEANLRDMYLALIATAMDRRVSAGAHPAFVEIIKQLEGDEAVLLRTILRAEKSLPIVQIREQSAKDGGWNVVLTHLMDLRSRTAGTPIENPNQSSMVDNWARLGLVDVRYDEFLVHENAYAWVQTRPEFAKAEAENSDPSTTISFQRGCIDRTAFGIKFAAAAGLLIDGALATASEGSNADG